MENFPCFSILQIHSKVWIDTDQKYKLVPEVIEAAKISGKGRGQVAKKTAGI